MNTLAFTKEDWDRQAYSIIRKLNGTRFNLEERLDSYYPKDDGKKVWGALSSFFISQSLIYGKLAEKLSEMENILFSTSAGVTIAASLLPDDYATDLLDNKRVGFAGSLNEIQNSLLHFLLEQLSLSSHRPLEDIVSSYLHCLQSNAQDSLDEETTKKFPQEIVVDAKKYVLSFSKKEEGKRAGSLGSTATASRRAEKVVDLEKYKVVPGDEKELSKPLYDYIAGHDQVKREFKRLALFVKNRARFETRTPRKFLFQNYLLVGPPGTGKTTLVKSLAGQCGLLFIERRGVEFGSTYINETASNIDALYKSAEGYVNEGKYPGVIIFIDEIDHLAKRRGYSRAPEDDKVITTLNTRLDGSSTVAGIITVGATNQEEVIDPAIISRFKRFYVGYPPTDEGVVAIYTALIKKAEERAKERLFAAIDYRRILEFSRHDERYKSGRVIEKILYESVMNKDVQAFVQKQEFQPVTTEELYKVHERFEFDEEKPAKPGKSNGRRTSIGLTR